MLDKASYPEGFFTTWSDEDRDNYFANSARFYDERRAGYVDETADPDHYPDKPQPPFVSKFGALFLDQLDESGPEHDWLIDGWLSMGDKSITGGPSQSGKSFLLIHAGLCIAHNLPFFGSEVTPGLVIYQAGEGARGVKKRLRAFRKHFGLEFSRETPFVVLQGKINLYGSEDTPKLIAEIKAIAAMYQVPLVAVFIDTLATAATGAEENSARDMGVVLDNISKINVATGAHVGLAHHMNAGGEKLRGSTGIYANLDQSIFVKRDPATKVRTASLGKQRDDDDDSPSIQFELMSVPLGEDKRGNVISSCVCLPVGEKEAVRRSEELKGFALRGPPKGFEEPFMRAFFQAERDNGVPVPTAFDLHPSVRCVVDYELVKQAFAVFAPNDEPDSPVDDEDDEQKAKRLYEREKKRRYRLGQKLTTVRQSLERFGVLGFGRYENTWFCWFTGKPLRGFPHTHQQDAPPPESGAPPFDDGIPF